MPQFTVSYSLRYEHVVQVGLCAQDEVHAVNLVQAAFDAGTLWDDTQSMRLLIDDWEECDNNQLIFEPLQVVELPAPDCSVAETKRHSMARQMLELLRLVARRCPIFTVSDIDLPTHVPVELEISEIRDLKACVASLDGC